MSPSSGSPPQARGRLEQRLHVMVRPRFTPAGTGKTKVIVAGTTVSAVHPRRHGEDSIDAPLSSKSDGSPPQARGRRESGPARRGGRAVHPRRHGEDVQPHRHPVGFGGSPPQARGRRSRTGSSRPNTAVHPRRHGEDATSTGFAVAATGSPPQARGRLGEPGGLGVGFRFTPAGTGKTSSSSDSSSGSSVHPRRHGEDLSVRVTVIVTIGSPPRARGRHVRPSQTIRILGFTPAGTGKTLRFYGFFLVFAIHSPSKSSNSKGAFPCIRRSNPCSRFAA